MKKTFTLFTLLLLGIVSANAQNDTLLYENFNDSTVELTWATINNGNDTVFVSLDADGFNDANGRPANWFWSATAFAGDDTTGCIFSSSWFDVVAICANYFITPPVQINGNTAQLSWRSAPRQTPRYVDGYKVLVSTTDNLETSFTDTLFVAGEFISGSSTNGFNYAAYSFTPGFIHGSDSTYIEFPGSTTTDSANAIGLLRPFTASLAQYAGQTIYIAWLHDSEDDNLIAVDDILVTGQAAQGIAESELLSNAVLYPNPATTATTLRFSGTKAGQASLRVYALDGSLKMFTNATLSGFTQEIGIPTAELSAGNYIVVAESNGAMTRLPLVVTR
ncbi:MAG: hypothetical protein RLZZ630_1474 [Bacteroidota bacterium]|jgi:hypothetical protein